MRVNLRQARRVVVGVIGATVVLLGGALLVLPGPGLLVVLIGLAILSSEFVWARKWLETVRERVESATGRRRAPPDSKREDPTERQDSRD